MLPAVTGAAGLLVGFILQVLVQSRGRCNAHRDLVEDVREIRRDVREILDRI